MEGCSNSRMVQKRGVGRNRGTRETSSKTDCQTFVVVTDGATNSAEYEVQGSGRPAVLSLSRDATFLCLVWSPDGLDEGFDETVMLPVDIYHLASGVRYRVGELPWRSYRGLEGLF